MCILLLARVDLATVRVVCISTHQPINCSTAFVGTHCQSQGSLSTATASGAAETIHRTPPPKRVRVMRPFATSATAVLPFLLLLLVLAAHGFNLDTHVRVRSKQTLPIPAGDGSAVSSGDLVRLTDYMRLPVEQYVCVPMPLNSKLSRLPGGTTNDFELVVPNVRFLSLEVQPIVHAVVTLADDRVIIEGDRCTLTGSPFVGRSRLNERFNFCVRAELSWVDLDSGVGVGLVEEGEEEEGNAISADTTIEVDVDTPFPFRTIGKRAIERMGDKALQISLTFILRSFLRGLASDYKRWAGDEEYRKSRAALAADAGNRRWEEEDVGPAFNHTGAVLAER